ncbi:MAG: pantothenate kinase [Candidatus Lokiarchaeota archaeon]|nr:pantothenate kinase [Candidatus Lokiarchaeota archaeon]
MKLQRRHAKAFVPGHITGLFRIHDNFADPLQRGSTGAGFSVKLGTITSIEVIESPASMIVVDYNDIQIEGPVTRTVTQNMLDDIGESYKIHVKHQSGLPIGVGFGASGAGALGTAFALGSIFSDKYDNQTLAQIAHLAEVENHSGLGDVIAQTVGGFELRTHPGAPGIGKIVNIPTSSDFSVVLAGGTGLDTSKILTNSDQRDKINRVGENLVKKIIDSPKLDTFIQCSQEFAFSTDLANKRIRQALQHLEESGFEKSGMVMLGNSVFCFCTKKQTDEVSKILSRHWNANEIFVTGIDQIGGRVL